MPLLATRLEKLGTETAFAVSAMAAEWRARGNRVFPFHLGDIDLAPPAAIRERVLPAILAGKNGYCPGAGIALLRRELAAQFGARRGVAYEAENVVVQPGGKPVIAKFLQAVMNPHDRVLAPVPGFPIYESQIRYQGGMHVPYGYLTEAGGFALDLEAMAAGARGARAMIFNNYHNPTGHAATEAELDAVARMAVENDLWVLNDDAYFEIRYDGTPARSILTRSGMMGRTINLFTFSKQFAMTGWRVGAAIGPAAAMAVIATMNTNMESCTTHFLQQAIGEALADGVGADGAPWLAALGERRDALVAQLNAIDGVAVAPPPSAFYVYCDVGAIMRRKRLSTVDALMRRTLRATGVSFCTGAHFGAGDERPFARFAFSGISPEDIGVGGGLLKRYFESEEA